MTFRIFIYCDDPSHPRRAAVTNFDALPDGSWHERPASRADRRQVGTGTTIVGNTLPEPGWALDPEVSNSDIRVRFELPCRRCRPRRVVPARRETLFWILDRCRAAGAAELSLAACAASLREQSERRRSPD